MDKLLYRIEEAADQLSIGRSKFYELIRRGEIKSVRIDGAVRVSARQLEEYAERLVKESVKNAG